MTIARRAHRAAKPLKEGEPAFAVLRVSASDQAIPCLVVEIERQTDRSLTGFIVWADGSRELVKVGFYDHPPKCRRNKETRALECALPGRLAREREVARFATLALAWDGLHRMQSAWDAVDGLAASAAEAELQSRNAALTEERKRLMAEVAERLRPQSDTVLEAANRLATAKAALTAARNAAVAATIEVPTP